MYGSSVFSASFFVSSAGYGKFPLLILFVEYLNYLYYVDEDLNKSYESCITRGLNNFAGNCTRTHHPTYHWLVTSECLTTKLPDAELTI